LWLLAFGAEPRATDAGPDPLQESLSPGRIDWRDGRLRASAGAAPDQRLPSPEAARPGAVRRARARAEDNLRDLLAHLPTSQKLGEDAQSRAVAAAEMSVEYQADGGAWVVLEVPFGPWVDPTLKSSPASDKAASNPWRDPVVLTVGRMRPVAGPVADDKGRRVVLWRARYRDGEPGTDQHALAVTAGEGGTLRLLDKTASWPADLAQRDVLIYVKALRP
jgi:hypothetical protein